MRVSAKTRVAGVLGRPVSHSLSPLLHNAWLDAAGIDGVYIAFSPHPKTFKALIEGMRGGAVAGFNVTAPFKTQALACADTVDPSAEIAGAANLLLFHADGRIEARNTDGEGLLAAFSEQAPMFHVKQGPVVVLGAGGAARGAVAAIAAAGSREIRVVNRTLAKAEVLAKAFGGVAFSATDAAGAFDGAHAIINATSADLIEQSASWPLDAASMDAIAMDMTYKPLETRFLASARMRGMTIVDGLGMLIGQARPSFQALFGAPVPEAVDARALLLSAMKPTP